MADKLDLYEILGVSKNATDAEIKTAYKNLAKKLHPDLQHGKSDAEKKEIEEKFKKVNYAYSVLSDPEKKSNYDRFGSEEGMGAGGFNWSGGMGGFEDLFSGIFNGMGGFGGRRNPNQPTQGDDINVRLTIDMEEAVYGCEKSVKITRDVKCSDCGGTGAKDGTAYTTCSHCHGKGVIIQTRNTLFGQTQVQSTCPYCNGTGKTITEKCKTCKGKGYVKIETSIKVKVPAGIDDDQVLTYRGEGQPGTNGGPNGDVNIIIRVNNSTLFKRDGYDLYIDIPIDIIQATLGATIEFPVFQGKRLSFDIPKGTQTNTVFRMKGKGIKMLRRESYGDIYVKVIVETPKNLTSKQKDLLNEFKESLQSNQIPKTAKFRNAK